ncbi:plasmid maintenance system antidote protein VapI [Lewinella aquimaris]|uniref:Plasmid maintenance system antidote protein VapI n=1 Tax=Neolewinella aquimaris TaxID=1835722 RepID=A0A840E611_9BACT|nr:helix-turn-helix transcriptional regulator [Neolewinella aquimaris]MBB4081094.1 plasmid maintenance system antidote protein VapI [Neolewinella aquimaris]
MKKSENIYKQLSKQLSDDEIVDSYVFNDDSLSDAEQVLADKEFRELRMKKLKEMTDAERLFGNLMRIKYRILDYFDSAKYDEVFSFSNQLREYSKIIGRSNKDFANDLDVHHTKLSRLINGKDSPSIELMYRLGEHSKGELPAHYWWRLHSKELEYKIITDLEKRMSESQRVTNSIQIRA